jgi:isopentenyl diphosphate isomerase/L-lactate dehydrogenase-like FMN-dependent dehydrogenase
MDAVLQKIAEAEEDGAFAVGMDIIFSFGGEIGDNLVRRDLMGPKTPEQLRHFVESTKLPFILKGILSEHDARLAVDAGADAIVVSNHGGSVLDYAVPPLMALPRIAQVVNGAVPIFVDGGITRGTDAFKALALGASGVLIGTAAMAGLAAGGSEGVGQIIAGISQELSRTMSLAGAADLASISPEVIWKR